MRYLPGEPSHISETIDEVMVESKSLSLNFKHSFPLGSLSSDEDNEDERHSVRIINHGYYGCNCMKSIL